MHFIDNGNIRPDIHLNASKLYLNKRGNQILFANIRGFLKKLFDEVTQERIALIVVSAMSLLIILLILILIILFVLKVV